MKDCIHCLESHPLTNFRKRKSSKDGHHYLCKPCHRAYEAEYRLANRDRFNERKAQWKKDNPERVVEHRTRFHENNVFAHRAHNSNRRAILLGIEGRLTSDDCQFVFEKYGEKCLRCGTLDDVQIDHVIPLTKGGLNVRDNLQPLCGDCNKSKRQKIEDYR